MRNKKRSKTPRVAGALCAGILPFAVALLVFIVAGAAPASHDDFNGTVYYLGQKEVQVISPVNASKLNLTLSQRTENITLRLENKTQERLNSSYLFWRGNYIYSLDFERTVRGELTYNMTLQGQQFILPLRDRTPVRIVLPPGYTTGNRFLGIASPEPDQSREIGSRIVLTWQNTSQNSYIEVNYYRKNAPEALQRIFAILALAAAVLVIEYYFSIRKLRAIRREEEERSGSMKKH